jgi:hypothetical protein
MSDGKKTEELACPGFDCMATVVVTLEQIAAGAQVTCANGHQFHLGGPTGASTTPTSDAEWSRTNKKTIQLAGGKKRD